MKDPVEKFLTDQDRRLVEASIREAEKNTSGEIVVKVVASSDRYPAAALIGGSLAALGFSIPVMFLLGSRDMWHFLAVFAVARILFNELFKFCPACRRVFVSASDMRETIEDAAYGAFVRCGIGDTKDRTGVLIFVSLFEHQVHVLADKGISAKVGPSVWQEVVETVVVGIKEHRPGPAIAAAVDRCGRILAEHFPVSGDHHRNELGDSLVMGRYRKP